MGESEYQRGREAERQRIREAVLKAIFEFTDRPISYVLAIIDAAGERTGE